MKLKHIYNGGIVINLSFSFQLNKQTIHSLLAIAQQGKQTIDSSNSRNSLNLIEMSEPKK